MLQPKRISRFPSDPGPAAWNELLPKAPPRAPLLEHRTADWVVVGAGFTGLSAARRLAELNPSDDVVLLEATGIAQGPAGRNSGFMIDLPHVLTSSHYSGDERKDAIDIRLNRAGIDYAMQAKEQFNLSDESINLSGKINGAISAKGLQHNTDYTKYLDSLSEPFERLDAQTMRKITGSEAYIDGVFTAGTAMIQPALFIRHIADSIESKQVRIYEHSPVTSLEKNAADWVLNTPSGAVTAPRIILATNGHIESFGYYQQQLMHVYTYGSMTQALSPAQLKQLGGQQQWALTPADPLGTTVRRISGTGGERLIIRNRATYDPSLKVDESRLHRISRTHDHSFSYRFPQLDNVRMAYRWGGRLCLSRNDVPVFGELESGVYAACCQNGLGSAKGTVSGKLVAELACGHSSSLLQDMMGFEEPSKLAHPLLSTVGATAFIRWGEWRAGKEM